MPSEEHVKVEVLNVLGYSLKTLVDESKPAGRHEVQFDGSQLTPGSYLVNVKTATGMATQRLVVK
nr:T9SS type A sorting domain-containing protein [Spirosoma rhododendri]